jgi:hypothetical protein
MGSNLSLILDDDLDCDHCHGENTLKFIEADGSAWSADHFECCICKELYTVETEIVFEPEF